VHRFIKAVGSGAKRARDLQRDEAREAMSLVASGRVEPVQVGAFLLSLRMKGESAEELAGFVDALAPHLAGAQAPPGTLDVDCHGDGHEGRATLLPAAACAVAALGVPVLLRADLQNRYAKHGLAAALHALGIPVAPGGAEAARSLAEHRLAVIDLETSCPPLARLVALRPLLGVRTAAQTLLKLIDPLHAAVHLVGVFHAPYLPSTARALGLLGERGLCVQALGGLPEATPGKQLRVAWATDAEPTTLDFRSFERPFENVNANVNVNVNVNVDEDAIRENRAAVEGEENAVARAVASGALFLHAARGTPIDEAAAQTRRALTDGSAASLAARLRG
jgi:anthranilate phosphoribosyltransferase